jgi:hypothetical protein
VGGEKTQISFWNNSLAQVRNPTASSNPSTSLQEELSAEVGRSIYLLVPRLERKRKTGQKKYTIDEGSNAVRRTDDSSLVIDARDPLVKDARH